MNMIVITNHIGANQQPDNVPASKESGIVHFASAKPEDLAASPFFSPEVTVMPTALAAFATTLAAEELPGL